MKKSYPSSVIITGATGAIGAALACEYARAGTTYLALFGRDGSKLREIKTVCESLGAEVTVHSLDMRDYDNLQDRLAQLCEMRVPDLVVCNAGINMNADLGGDGESWEGSKDLFDINIMGVVATVHGVLPSMRRQRSGQIALMSSLAAWRGLPETPSYCASKAAIKVYGEAMRDGYRSQGIRFNVIMPGYVDSNMSRDMHGPKPFLWKPGRAARKIRKGLKANRARITFPFPLTIGTMLLAGIHPNISGWILRKLGYGSK